MDRIDKDLRSLESLLGIHVTIDDSLDHRREGEIGCDQCDGYGNRIDERGARPCECKVRYWARLRLRECRLPGYLADRTLTNYSDKTSAQATNLKNVKRVLTEFRDGKRRGCFLMGEPGVGKTHLAVGLLKMLIAMGKTGVFYNVVDLLDAIKASYDPATGDGGREIAHEVSTRDVLVLDDFGAERMTPWVSDRLYAIINRRYQDGGMLIVTSNLNENDLGERIGYRTRSRLYEICGEPVGIIGADYRLPTPTVGRRPR